MNIDDFLKYLKNVKRSGRGFTSKCPNHDDQINSLSISASTDSKILLHCHAGCDTESILVKMGLTISDLFADGGQPEKRIDAVYPYTDENGKLLYEVVRYIPKDFLQRKPDGKGGYIWNLGDIRHVLYRLPEVIQSVKDEKPVYILEGEKDCNNIAKLGFTTTTNSGGAGKWHDNYSDYLKDGIVIIIPDNDDAGRKHTEQIARSVCGKARSVKIVNLTNVPVKGDITDFFHIHGKTKGLINLKKLIDSTPEYKKELQEAITDDHETQIEVWETPIPFDVFKLPSFPTKCLPKWVGEYVEVAAEDTQTPEDMAAVTALGILSIPCNKLYRIEGKLNWIEPMNIYTAVVMKPGERKTAIMKHMTRPVYEFEEDKNKRLVQEISRSQMEKKILEGEVNALQAKASKDGLCETKEKALIKAEELSLFTDIMPFRLTADDISPEKLAGLMAENGGKIAIVSAEGGIFDIMAGRYSQNSITNLDVF